MQQVDDPQGRNLPTASQAAPQQAPGQPAPQQAPGQPAPQQTATTQQQAQQQMSTRTTADVSAARRQTLYAVLLRSSAPPTELLNGRDPQTPGASIRLRSPYHANPLRNGSFKLDNVCRLPKGAWVVDRKGNTFQYQGPDSDPMFTLGPSLMLLAPAVLRFNPDLASVLFDQTVQGLVSLNDPCYSQQALSLFAWPGRTAGQPLHFCRITISRNDPAPDYQVIGIDPDDLFSLPAFGHDWGNVHCAGPVGSHSAPRGQQREIETAAPTARAF